MLGQLGSFRRRCQRVTQSLFVRGIATHQPGRRPAPAPPAPPPPPEKIEWWAVDGELFKAEKFDPKRVLAPLENEHIPNRKRRKERIRHLGQTRLKLRIHNQEIYWASYMKRYQIMRDEWEKHVWDPKPVPTPKPRNPSWVAEESEKYVWRDPRREAYTFDVSRDPRKDAYTFDISRMDQSATRSRFDNKIGYKGQGMNRHPFEGRRDPGGSSVRPAMTPMRRDSYKDSRPDQGAYKDERYGCQRNADIGRQNLRQFENEDFDDVFDNRDTARRHGNAMQHGVQSARHGNAMQHGVQSATHHQASLSTEDDDNDSEGVEFNWDESDSEDEGRDKEAGGEDEDEEEEEDDDDEDEVYEDQSQSAQSRPTKKGWYGTEEDLFKDDD